jgi:hypothetical protein
MFFLKKKSGRDALKFASKNYGVENANIELLARSVKNLLAGCFPKRPCLP